MSSLCSATVAYKQQPGLLTLTASTLAWSTSTTHNKLALPTSQIQSLFSSKPGTAKIMLRIAHLPPPNTEFYNFTFIATSSATSDRERFKKEISAIVANNRAGEGGMSEGTSEDKGKGKEILPPSAAPTTFHLRKAVLQSTPSLAALHRSLVQTGLLSEAEFWDGRQSLLVSLEADLAQKKGKSSEMVDPRPEIGEGGEVTVKITPGLIRDIFEEYPAVLRAYGDNVPLPLDEQQFWTRYFQSKLFNRNRTTNRAAVNTIKDDPIFDLYLGEEDDNLEPQSEPSTSTNRLLDLAATEADQHEVENLPDTTMRAGSQRASLPLMRRFNEHSGRLLDASLGVDHARSKRARLALDPGNAGERNEYYDQILLEDLSASLPDSRIRLEIADRAATSSSAAALPSSRTGDGLDIDELEEGQLVRGTKEMMSLWELHLGEFDVDRDAVRSTMDDLVLNIHQKRDRQSRDARTTKVFPDALLLSISTLQSSSNEFLRQFWSNYLPSPTALPPVPPATITTIAASRQVKVDKMLSYLEKVEEKVKGVLEDGVSEGVERSRIEAALLPVRRAVARALKVYHERV